MCDEKINQAPKIGMPHKNIQIALYSERGIGIKRMGVGKSLDKDNINIGRNDGLRPVPVLCERKPLDEAIALHRGSIEKRL